MGAAARSLPPCSSITPGLCASAPPGLSSKNTSAADAEYAADFEADEPNAPLSEKDLAALAEARKVLKTLDLDMDDQTAADLWHEYWALDKDRNGSVEVSEVKRDLMEGHHMSEKEINELLACAWHRTRGALPRPSAPPPTQSPQTVFRPFLRCSSL